MPREKKARHVVGSCACPSSPGYVDRPIQQAAMHCYKESVSAGRVVHTRARSSCKCSSSSGGSICTTRPSKASSQLHCTDTETVVLQEREGGVYEGQEQLRVFKLFRRKYVYHPTQQTFKPLDAMPAHLPRQIFAAMEALRAINLAGVLLVLDS